jgi:hypothetical protein
MRFGRDKPSVTGVQSGMAQRCQRESSLRLRCIDVAIRRPSHCTPPAREIYGVTLTPSFSYRSSLGNSVLLSCGSPEKPVATRIYNTIYSTLASWLNCAYLVLGHFRASCTGVFDSTDLSLSSLTHLHHSRLASCRRHPTTGGKK